MVSTLNCVIMILLFKLLTYAVLLVLCADKSIKVCLKKVKPNYFLLTYEGYPWERLCIKAVKEFHPNIKCVGYQHSGIFESQNVVYKSFNQKYDPYQPIFLDYL